MIVPMKKVSLVVLDREKKEALTKLKNLGIVHLENIEGKGETLSFYKNASETLNNAYMLLQEIKVKKNFVYEEISNEEAYKKAKRVLEITDRKKELFEIITNSTTELDRISGWGEMDPSDFDYLKEKGINISLYEIPSDKFNQIEDSVKTILVNSTKSITRFLVLQEKNQTERPQGLPQEAFNIVLPDLSTSDIMAKIDECKKELDSIQAEFTDSAKYLKSIKNYYNYLQKDIEFENVYSGMECESADTSNKLAWLTGFVPEDKFAMLQETATSNAWALLSSEPTEEDVVPTKLKNNKLVSLIYPLSDFLGTVPGYNEYDISGWFLLFFAIFFGMIFGDGGYGILLTLVISILMLKNKLAKKKNPPLMPLALILGVATICWGAVTCTWFGLSSDVLPEFLKTISIKPISNAFPKGAGELSTDQNLQIFCFTLALLQLTVAHFKGMRRYIKSLKFFGELGSLLQLWGMFYVVLSLVVSSEFFSFSKVVYGIPVGTVAIGLVAFGFLLGFIFANYEGSILASILESCKGIITVLLGVVNVFSDIISYIRLWAVGLAGAAISNTVNTMAGPLFGHAIMFVFALILLVGGHGLNMVLNLLSVIVHGVRLNTLEFSSHLGMSWSGIKYKPFS